MVEMGYDGKSVAAAIHHRPVGAVLRFSAEIRDRLADVIPADHVAAPYGGIENSDLGRELGPEGLQGFQNNKSIFPA